VAVVEVLSFFHLRSVRAHVIVDAVYYYSSLHQSAFTLMPVFVNGVVDDELVEFLFHARFI
jgi:hypothetical protein